jgi:hypothetical protein
MLEETMVFRFYILRLLILAMIYLCPGSYAAAENVILTLRRDGFAFSGELLAYNAGALVIKSEKYGVIIVEPSKFECSGAACPKPQVTALAIRGSKTSAAQLMPNKKLR